MIVASQLPPFAPDAVWLWALALIVLTGGFATTLRPRTAARHR
ncbi:hypothetical protein [Demequina aestuarii]|nr:hypothetical protein [Demequina aestuarii]